MNVFFWLVPTDPNCPGERATKQVALVVVHVCGWVLYFCTVKICSRMILPIYSRVQLYSVSMYHDLVGEFWYELRMTAEPPVPTLLPSMECELGRWTQQDIVLCIPTDDVIRVEPIVSNSNNFQLEYDTSTPLELHGGTPLVFPLTFVPSVIGPADQTATIVFRSEQVRKLILLTADKIGQSA